MSEVLKAAEAIILVLTIVGAITAVFVVRLTQRRADEWKEIAIARGTQIEDFRSEVSDLRNEVAELRGAVTALESVNAEKIATRVVDLMGRSGLRVAEE